jgi:hypothetical protein
MPIVHFTDEELAALFNALTTADRVNWTAYDAAKARIIAVGRMHYFAREAREARERDA